MTDGAIMTDRVRQRVLDYLLGVLDDSDMDAVKNRLESDPLYRQALPWARRDLVRLHRARQVSVPPPGLAERTCDFLFDPTRRLRAAMRSHGMTAVVAPPHSGCRMNWADAGVAAAVFVIAGLLVLPAINGTRFQSRVTTCQDNLRRVGQALVEYSHKNHEVFPAVPAEGNLSAAGIYAPILAEEGYLAEPERLLCPNSTQAQERDFRVPTLEALRTAVGARLSQIQQTMGGSYGYCLGYFDHGIFQPTRNLNRDYFAIMADAPSFGRADRKSDNHDGVGQNVLFEDMHIEFCSTTRPGSGIDDIYCNDKNEIAPGLHRDDAVIASSGTVPVIYLP
jgi:hypothetical protein